MNPLGHGRVLRQPRTVHGNFNDRPDQAASRPMGPRTATASSWAKAPAVAGAGRIGARARSRGATIYAEIGGYGLSGDAHHITAPAEGHEGAYRAMKAAFRNGGAQPGDVQYVNAHGTSTPLGDDLELEAVERFFGDDAKGLAMSSTKSATGHLLGAAGAIEAIFSLLAIRDSVVPPTLNLENPSRASVIDRVPLVAQERRVDVALSNSFGFGGTNASILFKRAA